MNKDGSKRTDENERDSPMDRGEGGGAVKVEVEKVSAACWCPTCEYDVNDGINLQQPSSISARYMSND